MVGANCRGFVNACRLPQRLSRQALALEMPGRLAGRLVKARTDFLLHPSPHPLF